MPKYAPCGSPLANRATTSSGNDAATALSRFPSVNADMSARSSALRGIRAASTASSGAPTTTPSAYAEIRCPASGMVAPRSPATSGRMPIVANSVVPIAKPPSASASRLMPTGQDRSGRPRRRAGAAFSSVVTVRPSRAASSDATSGTYLATAIAAASTVFPRRHSPPPNPGLGASVVHLCEQSAYEAARERDGPRETTPPESLQRPVPSSDIHHREQEVHSSVSATSRSRRKPMKGRQHV